MAGEWMKVELALPDKPEVHYMANALNLDPDAVVGKLIRVWAWFDQHTEDGNAHGVTGALLDRLSGVTGFGEVMLLAGWIEQRDKTLHMPKFDRHTSESSKKRALTAKRQAKFRNTNVTQEALPREEKRREDKNIKTKAQDFALPTWIDPKAWQEFEEHRKKLRKPMTDRARGLIVAELEKLKPDKPEDLLMQSIRKGWQDVFPLKSNNGAVNGKFNVHAAGRKMLAEALASRGMGDSPTPEVFSSVPQQIHQFIPRSTDD